jgi:hypothetical protein
VAYHRERHGALCDDDLEAAMSKAWTRAALATGLLMVVGAPAALAGAGGARQDPAQLKFTTGQPSSATGASILIDYVNPSDPSAKPFGVDRVETIFHRGTKIDTSVPAQCDPARAGAVPNDQCPAGSEVGGGTLRFDQGNGPAVSPAFPRILRFRVTLFNAPNLVLFRLDGTNNPIRGLLAPSEVRGGRTIRAEVPHLPGGPPDNQIAIDLANIRYKRISNPRGNYITTPASCPRIGAWTNRLTFSYNDDANPDFEVVQSPRTRPGCASGGGAGGGGGPGRTIAGTAGDDVLRGTAATTASSAVAAMIASRRAAEMTSSSVARATTWFTGARATTSSTGSRAATTSSARRATTSSTARPATIVSSAGRGVTSFGRDRGGTRARIGGSR